MKSAKQKLRTQIYQTWESTKIPDSASVVEQLSVLEVFKGANNIYVYAPDIRCEIDFVRDLMIKNPNKKYFFPRVEDQNLKFYLVENYDHLAPGSFGMLEPSKKGSDSVPDLILVPGLAFDAQGFRLGRGGGFYDRFLVSKKAFRIGIIPEWAFFYQIPRELHDQGVDQVISL